MLLDERDEILVLAHDRGAGRSGGGEYLSVLRVPEAEIAYGLGINAVSRFDPLSDSR